MVQSMLSVNWLAILVCGVVLMVVGFIWYTAFGQQWAKYTGWTREKVSQIPQNQMIMNYVLSFIAGLVMVFVLAFLFKMANITTVRRALAMAAIVWAGFTAAPAVSNTTFEHRPWGLFLLVNANYLIGLLISGVILCVWR